jgi:hypothetical protein
MCVLVSGVTTVVCGSSGACMFCLGMRLVVVVDLVSVEGIDCPYASIPGPWVISVGF